MAEETPKDRKQAADAALKPQKPKARIVPTDEDEKRGDELRTQRRKFVSLMFTGFVFAMVGATLKFFFPRVLFEPKTKFRIGTPAEYGFGVDTRWQSTQRIWVVKNAEGLFVILAKCTHLGCTPDWKGAENKFKCPCHGSGFTKEGINFEGPAPRPLDRCFVEMDAEGQIVVDKLRLFKAEQFKNPGALLNV